MTADNQLILEAIDARGWFSKKEDIAKFCMGYAIRAGTAEGSTTGTDTRWAVGNFDKTGEIRTVVTALYPGAETPVRLIEHLVNEGLRFIGGRLRTVTDLATLFDQPDEPIQAHRVLYGAYEVVRPIGGGGMAETYCVRSQADGSLLFLKRVATNGTTDQKALQREQQIYSKLQHLDDPAVLRIVAWERDADSVAIVTEFAAGGSLSAYVKAAGGALSVANAKKIGVQVISSLAALHGVGIVHRDLKPDNVVSAGGTWKLADFGIAKNLSRLVTQHTFTQHHTPGYAPPEQVEGAEAHPSADIYAFGKLLSFMLTGQTDPDKIPSAACRLLARDCTRGDPVERSSLEEVKRSLLRIVA